MKILRPILNLVNCLDYLPATLAATLLGGVTGGENSMTRLGIAVLSNLLLYGFALIYQKIENAPVAAVETDVKTQNPIATGTISIRNSRTLSAILVLVSLALAALVSQLNIVLALLGVLIALALSNRRLNFGNSVLMHLGKQQPLLSALFALSGFLATAQKMKYEAILLIIFILAFGFLFAAWTVEKSNRSLGRPLLIVLLVSASAAAYALFIVLEIIPAWVVLLIVLLSSALAFTKHHFNPNQQSLSQILFDSLAVSTVFSLVTSYLVQVFF